MRFSLEAKTCDSPKFHSLHHWNGAAKQSRILSTRVVNHKLPTHSLLFFFFLLLKENLFCSFSLVVFGLGCPSRWEEAGRSLSYQTTRPITLNVSSSSSNSPFFSRRSHKRSRPNQDCTFCKILTAPSRQISPAPYRPIQEEEQQQSVFPTEIFFSFCSAICRVFLSVSVQFSEPERTTKELDPNLTDQQISGKNATTMKTTDLLFSFNYSLQHF